MPSLTRSRILTRQPTFSRSQVLVRTWPYLLDLLIAAAGLATFYAVLMVARNWMGIAQPSAEIHLVPRALPLYALYSVIRIFIAYLLSLGFAVGYGYVAAYNPRVEPLMVAVLDILQSIPVLSFLPPVMLAMVALIPTRQLGLELGAILLIFTGQVWNMAFSFYSSLKSMPKELREASDIYKFSAWQRFWQLEMPFSAIGLVWNSMVSVAGGWFALIACEMFTLGAHDFRLPGLGSYLQTSASQGDTTAMVWGLAVMLIIIVVTDQLLWRPLITWSDRFKFENVESQRAPRSRVLEILQQSRALHAISQNTLAPLSERIYHSLGTRHVLHPVTEHKAANRAVRIVLSVFAVLILAALLVYSASHALLLLKDIRGHQLLHLLGGAAATFLRVQIALVLAAAWTIPAGVAIGFNPRLARICQPIAQIAASFPATTLFPHHDPRRRPIWRRPRHRLHPAHAPRHAVVHPLQRHRRRHGHPLGDERSRDPLPLHQLAKMADCHPARHLPLPHHGNGHRVRRRLERQHLRGILPLQRPHHDHHRTRRANSRRHRRRTILRPARPPRS